MESEDPSSFRALYISLLFLVSLYAAGDLFCSGVLRIVPSLTGQIFIGILFGPHVLNLLPGAWVTAGTLGLTLLICQAGIETDFVTLRAIGPRSAVMALVGSVLPISLAFLMGRYGFGLGAQESIAAACSFGPTSAGIAMNVLGRCGVLRSKLGQLVVAVAIVDDIIALVVLSQLGALTADVVSVRSVLVPILSALLWLLVGGAAALYVVPTVLGKVENVGIGLLRRATGARKEEEGEASRLNQLWHVIPLLLALLPATYYTEASFLMGAFLVGIAVCRNPRAANDYDESLNRPIEWLMRIFFGATIGFSVPVTLFDDSAVVARGFLLSLALAGKVAIGPLLTPVLTEGGRRFDSRHRRDCAVVGLSMAGEAEFAFLVAEFGLSGGLMSAETYASVVFAVLLSTIVSPVLLRTVLALWKVQDDDYGEEKGGDEVSMGDDVEDAGAVTVHGGNISSNGDSEEVKSGHVARR